MTKIRLTKAGIIAAAAGACALLQTFAPVARGEAIETISTAPAAVDWTGLYIGGNLGASWSNYDFGGNHSKLDVTQQFFQFEGPALARTQDAASRAPQRDIIMQEDTFLFFSNENSRHGGGTDLSMTGGAQLGYNKQWGHIVIGTEGSFNGTSNQSDWARGKSFETSPFFFDGVSAETTETSERMAKTYWNAAVVGKLGYATGPVLFYVLGGVSFTDLAVFARDHANTDFFINRGGTATVPQPEGEGGGFIGSFVSRTSGKDEGVMVGWTAGTGVEYAVNKLWSVGVEYRHIDAGDRNFHFSSKQGPLFPGNTNVGTDSDQLTFKVNLWLGHLPN